MVFIIFFQSCNYRWIISIYKWKEFKFIKRSVSSLQRLSKKGYSFIVITNQAGIGRNLILKKDLNEIHKKMTKYLLNKGIKILKIYVCPHHWLDNCDCRKPKPKLFFKASEDFLLNLSNTKYIGDDKRDMVASKNAGCKGIYWKNSKKFEDFDKIILNKKNSK